MPHWAKRIRLGDVFHNETLTFPQRRNRIVEKIRRSGWTDDNADVADLVDELAETDDVDWFDHVWAAIYDEANADRVWIDTMSGRG